MDSLVGTSEIKSESGTLDDWGSGEVAHHMEKQDYITGLNIWNSHSFYWTLYPNHFKTTQESVGKIGAVIFQGQCSRVYYNR